MREIAAVAVSYRRENVFAIARGFEHDLCDPRKIFPNRVGVLGVGRAELMKINLLIKIQVGFGALALPWETRVINAGPVRVPGRSAAGGGVLCVRERVRKRLGRPGVVNRQSATFASAFRPRNGDVLAIK